MPLLSTDQWHHARGIAETGAGIALTDGPDSERLALGDPGPEVIGSATSSSPIVHNAASRLSNFVRPGGPAPKLAP